MQVLNEPFYRQILQDLPGLIIVMNFESKFLCSNDYTAKMFGYENEEKMLGIDAYGMRCPAVKSAPDFLKQDKLTREQKSTITILDVHEYANNQKKLLLTKKKPILIAGEICTICHCIEIDSKHLSMVSNALIHSDKFYHSYDGGINRSYLIDQTFDKCKLSRRELDCLFYLLRGKTMKMIAKILNISWRTVESHINKIKYKWQCRTKNDIIEYAIVNGFLEFVPSEFLNQDFSQVLMD